MNEVCTVALMRHGGSHLIRPIIANLGFKIIEPGNFGEPIDKAQGPVIVWLRDPRDRMASTLRWWKNKPRKNELLKSVTNEDDNDGQLAWLLEEGGFLNEMLFWAEIWCDWKESLTVRFEDVRYKKEEAIKPILEYLNIDCDPKILLEPVFEKGRTFNGEYSDWKKTFGEKSLGIWNKEDKGQELLSLMGY